MTGETTKKKNQVKIDLTIDKNSEMLSYFMLVSFRLLGLPWKPHPVWSPRFPFCLHPSAWGLKKSWKGTNSECSESAHQDMSAHQAWVLWECSPSLSARRVLTETRRQDEIRTRLTFSYLLRTLLKKIPGAYKKWWTVNAQDCFDQLLKSYLFSKASE